MGNPTTKNFCVFSPSEKLQSCFVTNRKSSQISDAATNEGVIVCISILGNLRFAPLGSCHMGAEDDSMLKMKVERSSRGRGGKKGAHGGRRDLLVTVPNVESAESRLKPPVVNSTQRRKIVLSQNKTGNRMIF